MNRFGIIVFCLAFINNIQSQQSYYGLEKQADFISTFNEGKSLLATSGSILKIWNTETAEISGSLDVKEHYEKPVFKDTEYACYGGIGVGQINPKKTRLGMMGTKYYPKGAGDIMGSVFIDIDLETLEHKAIPLNTKDEVLRFKFHPTNDDLLGLIIMDTESFEYYSCIYNLSQQKTIQKLLIGKGSLIPLFIEFSNDGQFTFVSYGNSSYNGGIEIYETSSGKLIKKLPLKEQPKTFFYSNELLVAGGHSSTLFINTQNWTVTHTERGFSATTYDADNGKILGHQIDKDDTKLGVLIEYTVSSKTQKSISVEKSIRPIICSYSTEIFAIHHKDYRKKEEEVLTLPSVLKLKF